MLLLVTILLVVVGTISLVIGFLQSALLPIYISIACSVLAAVVLLIFSRMTAKSQQVVTSGQPAPLPGRGGPDAAPEPAFAGTGLLEGSSADRYSTDTTPGYTPEESYAAPSRFSQVSDLDEEPDDDFPIERYDSRRVGEILPLLAELDLDELDLVREHEEQHKNRATVLARIDQLIDQLEAEDRQEAASRFDDDSALAAVPAGGGGVDVDVEPESEREPIAPPPPTQAVTVAALPEDDGYFPIEDYDELRAGEILPLLPELDDDELVMVQQREEAGPARPSILRRIEALLATSPAGAAPVEAAPPSPVEPVPAPEPEPIPEAEPAEATSLAAVAAGIPSGGITRKVSAKAAAAKKSPAKKAAAKKTAVAPPPPPPPPKKAPAVKKAAATKATTKAAPISKSGATSTRAKKAAPAPGPVKKAPAAKAPAAKKAAVVKAPAAKATAAKSSTKAAKTTRKATK